MQNNLKKYGLKGFEINTLTVMANENHDEFAKKYKQKLRKKKELNSV